MRSRPINPERNVFLDGLRAFAVLFVLFHHWTDWGYNAGLGQIGVQTFFVISGFLITRILLSARMRVGCSSIGRLYEIRSFFIRRTLRIFPIYYLLLVASVLADRFDIRQSAAWHFLFVSNYYFFEIGEFNGKLSHLWTLSVEEQFYLFWPWVVLFTPRKILPFVILVLILVGPITRVGLSGSGFSAYAQYNTPTFSNFDSLGIGALLGWGHTLATNRQQELLIKCLWFAAPIALALFVLLTVTESQLIKLAVEQLALAVVVAAIIQATNIELGRSLLHVLSFPVFVYLGQISYGIYLYHPFALNVVGRLIEFSGAPEYIKLGISGFLLQMLVTMGVASVSWFCIEKPINSLKSRFPYTRPQVSQIDERNCNLAQTKPHATDTKT